MLRYFYHLIGTLRGRAAVASDRANWARNDAERAERLARYRALLSEIRASGYPNHAAHKRAVRDLRFRVYGN